MIEAKNIQKAFGEKKVLNDVSCCMSSGKVSLIIGASGSGKPSLTECLVGLIMPDSGQILYEGEDLTAMDDKRKKNFVLR